MDCLLAKAIPCVTDCVVAELEKLGPKYRVALRLSKDPRFQRLPCSHQGTYADDCLVQVRSGEYVVELSVGCISGLISPESTRWVEVILQRRVLTAGGSPNGE